MKQVLIATHDGIFHADEVFALATLQIYLTQGKKQIKVLRTRDMSKISQANMAVDVGGEYLPTKYRFDHHQKGKAGFRKNTIPYASFGLIWKHFGRKITSSKKVWESLEKKLVTPVDALDNGINLSTPIFKGLSEYTNAHIISAIGSAYGTEETNLAFEKAVEFAVLILKGEIKKAEAKIQGEILVNNEIIKQGKPQVLVLEKYITWDAAVSKHKNVKLVVYPDGFSDRWCIQAARDNLEIFNSDRISFPVDWRGLSNSELSLASGVVDSIFCHAGGFFAVAKSKDAAITMAQKTIDFDPKLSK